MYCSTHKKEVVDDRLSATERGYGYEWQIAKRRFLREHPWCMCEDCRGKAMRATTVDHIIPHKGNQELFWKRSNWQSMSELCHNRKTAEKDGGFGR
jgi:5-methylcytosine-specific restriction protein A